MKSYVVTMLILGGVFAQAKSLDCKVVDTSTSVVLSQRSIEFTDRIEKQEVASQNGVSFKASVEGKQVEVTASTSDPFNFSSLSVGRKKKAAVAAEMNGLRFNFACEIVK